MKTDKLTTPSRFLIVDPRRGVRDELRHWLHARFEGADVAQALDPGEAAAIMRSQGVDCMIVSSTIDGPDTTEDENSAIPSVLMLETSDASRRPPNGTTAVIVRDRLNHIETFVAVRAALEAGRLRRELELHRRGRDEEETFEGPIEATTELPTRSRLVARLSRAMESGQGDDEHLGLLMIGLDGFKAINTTLGHRNGDALLCQAAKRLKHCVRAADTIARWGGDEFAVLLDGLARIDDAMIVAQRIVYALSRPFDDDVHIAASVGIAFSSEDGSDAETLMRHADVAMYQVKNAGGNGFQRYSPRLDEGLASKRAIESRLRAALEREEFFLVYQPQIDTRSGAVVGLEALLRWKDPEAGVVSPNDFVPILEKTGLIVPVGDWVLRKACTQARAWQFGGVSGLRVSVNLSAVQFRQRDLVARIRTVLEKTGLSPESLELEVTESVLMEDPAYAAQVLTQVHEMGSGTALDDFGTGHSSLGSLKSFPVDTLKIDRSFIEDIEASEEDRNICSAVVALGRALRLRVLAEGVETQEQSELLSDQGCHLVQGFFYSRPMPADDVWTWLTAQPQMPEVESSPA